MMISMSMYQYRHIDLVDKLIHMYLLYYQQIIFMYLGIISHIFLLYYLKINQDNLYDIMPLNYKQRNQ